MSLAPDILRLAARNTLRHRGRSGLTLLATKWLRCSTGPWLVKLVLPWPRSVTTLPFGCLWP